MQYPQGPYQGGPQFMPPRPKRGLSVLAILAIGIACAFGGCLVCAGVALHKSPEQKAEDDARKAKYRAEAEAAAASAEAQQRIDDAKSAEANAKLKKVCKSPIDVEVPSIDKVIDRCQAMVRMNAKVPDSVEFPSSREDNRHFTSDDGCNYVYTSYFDGQNAFGVKVRTRYRCAYDPITTAPSIKTL